MCIYFVQSRDFFFSKDDYLLWRSYIYDGAGSSLSLDSNKVSKFVFLVGFALFCHLKNNVRQPLFQLDSISGREWTFAKLVRRWYAIGADENFQYPVAFRVLELAR